VTTLDELEKRLEGPGLIVALTKDEARALLSAAREGERLREALTVLLNAVRVHEGEGGRKSYIIQPAAYPLARCFAEAALQSEKPHVD